MRTPTGATCHQPPRSNPVEPFLLDGDVSLSKMWGSHAFARGVVNAAECFRSGGCLDGCDTHQILHGMGELPIERDQSVGLELPQCDVLGVERV
jgi:uncharacterized Fe-S center protein